MKHRLYLLAHDAGDGTPIQIEEITEEQSLEDQNNQVNYVDNFIHVTISSIGHPPEAALWLYIGMFVEDKLSRKKSPTMTA